MTTFTYPATLTRQTDRAAAIVLFSAPCVEIAIWAGVPQKRSFGETMSDETVGFQRVENGARVASLQRFFENQENVSQNPILCAARSLDTTLIRFEPDSLSANERVQPGKLIITPPSIDAMSYSELFLAVKSYLEKRVPDLATQSAPIALIERLKKSFGIAIPTLGDADTEEFNETGDGGEAPHPDDDTTSALFEDSHISDFWEEIAARYEIASSPGVNQTGDEFLGFTRGALAAYVLPTFVVDGQHRLLGAIKSAEECLSIEPWKTSVQTLISEGLSSAEVNRKVKLDASRILPISLLMSDNPAEQVFQFVVVNQKATPIGKPLLGTIVSTTLSQVELNSVQERLKDSGIPISESKAISSVARDPGSPFYQKVNRGMNSDAKDLLDWNVLGQLIAIFKNLNGGKLYGESNDYAVIWRRKYLSSSPIVQNFSSHGYATAFEYWASDKGPWKDVFLTFWAEVRGYFGDKDDSAASNYWGSPRNSNLFNMVSLTILTADFFSYLCESKVSLNGSDHIKTLVADWLTDVKDSYFSRNWNLSGVKKDSTGIKKQWATQWKEYRKDPERLPKTTVYRTSST